MSWNFDISQAPKGTMEKRTRTIKGKVQEYEEFVPVTIIAASDCRKVGATHWIPANKHHNGYWWGFASDPKYGVGPIAWQPMPTHPSMTEAELVDAIVPVAAEHLPIIEDVGGV